MSRILCSRSHIADPLMTSASSDDSLLDSYMPIPKIPASAPSQPEPFHTQSSLLWQLLHEEPSRPVSCLQNGYYTVSSPSTSVDERDEGSVTHDEELIDVAELSDEEFEDEEDSSEVEVSDEDEEDEEVLLARWRMDDVEESDSESTEVVEVEKRCVTPEFNAKDQKRFEYIQGLTYTTRHRQIERDTMHMVARGLKEQVFTQITNDREFSIFAPFLDEPICQIVRYPVDENIMDFLEENLPLSKLMLLKTRQGFIEFARELEFKGHDYRRKLLIQRAYNRAIREPAMEDRLDEVEDSPTALLESVDRRRRRRCLHTAATAMEGATPTGRKLPRRRVRLFADEEGEERKVKRRRLDLDAV